MESDNGSLNFKIRLDTSELAADAAKSKNIFKNIGDSAVAEGARIDKAFSATMGKNSKFIADAEATKRAFKGIGDSATQQGSIVGNAFKSAYGMIAIAGIASIGMLGREILNTTAKFEKFGIVLKNTLGEAKGGEALNMLANFAATTPFQLDEVTDAFIRMANQGFVPTRDQMIRLGDLASSTGKSFDQLAEALLDAQTSQFERLKEFGIKASANGDRVTFSFKEQKTTVENTNKAIQAYLLSLGELKGVAGANEKISASLTGQMSNLGDKMAAMYNEIGTANKGILYAAVGGASKLIENYKAVGEAVGLLIGIYGVYKVATMAVTYADNLRVAAFARNRAIMVEYQAIMATQNILEIQAGGRTAILAAETNALALAKNNVAAAETRMAAASKASMLTNPYILSAMAVAALGYAIYKVVTYQSDLEKATKKATNEISNEKDKAAQLFAELNNATEGTDEWKRAKQGILDQYGNYLTEQQKELTNTQLIAEAYKRVGEEIEKTINIKVRDEALAAVSSKYVDSINGGKKDLADEIKSSFDRETAANYNQKVSSKIDLVQYEIDPVKKEKYKAELSALIQEIRVKISKDGKLSANKDMSDISYAYSALIGNINKDETEKAAVLNAFKTQASESAAQKSDPILTTYEAQIKDKKVKLKEAEALLAELKTNDYTKLQSAKKAEIAALEASVPITKGEVELDALNAKIEKAKNELAIINTKGVDPMKAITAQQGIVDALYKQLGVKEKAAEVEKKAVDALKQAQENLEKAVKSGNQAAIDGAALVLVKLQQEKDLLDEITASAISALKNQALPTKGANTISEALNDMKKATGLDFSKGVASVAKEQVLEYDKLAKKVKDIENFKEDQDNKALARQKELTTGFYDIADSAAFLSQQIGDSNKGLADMLKSVGNIAGSMGNFADKGAFSKATFDADGNQLTGMSKADAYGAAISGATQLVGMFISQAAENKRVMEDYYASVIKQQNDYNLSLNEQMRLNTEINGSIFFDDFKAKMSDASKALTDATDKKNKAMKEFYGSEAIVGKKNVVSAGNVLGGIGAGAAMGAGIGTLLGGGVLSLPAAAAGAIIGGVVGAIGGIFAKKKKDIVAPLLETYPLLIKANGDFDAALAKTLIGTENITKETSDILQNIIDWEDAAKAASEQITAIIVDMTGTIGTDLRNALVDAFENGTDAAKKFGEATNKILENILSQTVFNTIFKPALKDLQTGLFLAAGKDAEGNPLPAGTPGVDGDLMTPIRQFLTLVPGLTDMFNGMMKTTNDETKTSTVSTRGMTDEEKATDAKLRAKSKENSDAMTELYRSGKNTSESVRIAQANITASSQALIDFQKSLLVTTPGLDLFGGTTADRAGSSKGITSMSQDTGDEMNGRLTAMQGHTFSIAAGMDILKANSTAILNNVIEIKGHTLSMQADMKSVKGDMKSVKDGIDTINLKGITLKN